MLSHQLAGKIFRVHVRRQQHGQHIGFAHHFKVGGRQSRSQIASVVLQALHQLWMLAHLANTLQCGGGHWRWQGNCPDRGGRHIHQRLEFRHMGADGRTGRSRKLREGGHDQGHNAFGDRIAGQNPKMLIDAAARGPQRAAGVGFVHQQHRAGIATEHLDHFRQRSHIPIHRKHRIRHHKNAIAWPRMAFQLASQILRIAVAVSLHPHMGAIAERFARSRPGVSQGRDNAAVVQHVRHDQGFAIVGKTRHLNGQMAETINHGLHGHPGIHEQLRVRQMLEAGNFIFQLAVQINPTT